MAITTLDGFIGSTKQYVSIAKTTARTSVATSWFSLIDLAGNPGAGVLAGTSLTAGVVPTDATAGLPTISAFPGGSTGYLAQVEFGNTVACRLKIFDLVWKGGAYPFNANQGLSAQPSFLSRMPGGSYGDTQIWLEQVTAGTGVQNVIVTYTNQSGTTNKFTNNNVAFPTAANIVGRMWQIPLSPGDTGVQTITNVAGSVATAGTFNILVMRPLWSGRVRIANDGDVHAFDRTAMPEVFADSALYLVANADATSTGIPEVELVIAAG